MTIQPGLELWPDLVDLVGTNNMQVVAMYLMYVDTFLAPYVALGLDIAVRCYRPGHLFYLILRNTSTCDQLHLYNLHWQLNYTRIFTTNTNIQQEKYFCPITKYIVCNGPPFGWILGSRYDPHHQHPNTHPKYPKQSFAWTWTLNP